MSEVDEFFDPLLEVDIPRLEPPNKVEGVLIPRATYDQLQADNARLQAIVDEVCALSKIAPEEPVGPGDSIIIDDQCGWVIVVSRILAPTFHAELKRREQSA